MDGDGANKKRATERQLTKDNYKDNDDDEEGATNVEEGVGDFARATEEALKTRQIRRVRRTPAVATTTGHNPFAGISLTATAPSAPETKEEKPTTEDERKTAEETSTPTPTDKDKDVELCETVGNGQKAETSSIFDSIFQTPSSMTQTTMAEGSASVPSVSTLDPSRFKPLDQVTSGEESEETVYTERASLFSSSEGQWKTAGRGDVKINVNKEGVARLLMRQEVTLKLLLNARLYPEMKPVTMAENAVSFTCQNNVDKAEKTEKESEDTPVYDIVALRFKTDTKKKVERFVEALETYKNPTRQQDAST